MSIVLRFDGFGFHPFLEKISTMFNAQGVDLKQWNGKCISIRFLWLNINYEVTTFIVMNYTLYYRQHLFQLSLSVA